MMPFSPYKGMFDSGDSDAGITDDEDGLFEVGCMFRGVELRSRAGDDYDTDAVDGESVEVLMSRLYQEAPRRSLTNTTRKVISQGVATCLQAFRRAGRLEHRPFRFLEIFAGALVIVAARAARLLH